jgi:Flp pilus assembly protein TadD
MGDTGDAQKLLQDLPIRSEDDAYRRDFLLVMAEVRNEDHEQALVLAREMQGRWADDARFLNLLGGILKGAGDRDAARQSFQTARALDPTDIVSLINLAVLDINAGNFDAAYRRYERALELQPQNVGIMLSLGRVAAFRGDRGATISWLEKAREADATNLVSRLMLGKLYIVNRDFAAAEQVAREGIALNQDVADLYNTLGLAVSANGEHDDALQFFKRAIALNSNEPGYNINLAREYLIGDDQGQARDILFSSLQSRPDHIQTAMILAVLYAQAGDAAQTIPSARDLQEQNPETVGPKILLAELYYSNEQFDQGAVLYDEALNLSGDKDVALRAYQLRAASGQAVPEAPLLKYLASRPTSGVNKMEQRLGWRNGESPLLGKTISQIE